jgi:large subunit ribosomal protein L23
MRIEEVLRRPLLTEKVMDLKEGANVIAFEVDPRANRIEVKRAVETQFDGARVAAVRIARMHGKNRRQGRFTGRRPDWKKAYVRLTADSKPIDFFEGG